MEKSLRYLTAAAGISFFSRDRHESPVANRAHHKPLAVSTKRSLSNRKKFMLSPSKYMLSPSKQ
ncbi:MAG: hypothetical protein Q4E49_05490, partial [Bacteroidales bacterium]|nr:hypothetical protein [Bacteroidales bacterium]